MKRWTLIVSLILGASIAALADSTPSLEISSDGSSTSVPLPSEGNGLWGFTDPASAPLTLTLNGSTISLSWVNLDTDPSVSYGIGVTNNNASAASYTFTFNTPVTLAAGQYSVSSSAAGSLTDGGSDGVTLSTPTTGGAIQQAFIGATNAGVDLLSSNITDPNQSSSDPIPKQTASALDTINTSASQISLTTAFQLTAGDSATLSGRFDVAAVPEPRSAGLGLICAAVFAILIVRRRRNT